MRFAVRERSVFRYQDGHPSRRLRRQSIRSRRGPAVLIYAGGEIDACNEQTWRHLVSEAAGVVTAPGPLIVDVTGLDFMGCCAFAVLAEEAENLRRRGVELRLVSWQPFVARIVDACGLSGVLPLYPTADSALAR
jgi:anti-anti-sigma factor